MTTAAGQAAEAADQASTAPRVAWGISATIAGGLAAVVASLNGRYGYHRDELYFLASGRHPAWGYPDQPPLTPMLARLFHAIAPGSLIVFRLPAVLAMAGVIVLAGLLARELGGGAFAQGLAALATGTGTIVLLAGHLLSTATVDLLVWVTLTWLVVRALRTGHEWLWLVAGVVTGIGLLNKQMPVFLVFGLAVGAVLTPQARPVLRSRWLWAGAVVAGVMWAPVLVWQAEHGWPQLTLAGQIHDEFGAAGERVGFYVLQLVLISLGATYLWVTGLVQLWREPAWRRYRVVAWAWVAVMVVFTVTAGQGYYPAGLYPALIAAGAVVVARRSRWRWLVAAVVVATSAMTLPIALPVLSPSRLAASAWSGPGEVQRETVGWPGFVDQVAAAYRSIPAPERRTATVFTANYGEAGAVDLYGPSRGLPPAWSGHNGYALWGPPAQGYTPVVVVWEDGAPTDRFSGCRLAGKVVMPVANEEADRASIYVCEQPIGGWRAAWPLLTHLSS